MVLIPEANAGFFLVNQLEGSNLRDILKETLLQRFFPKSRERRVVPVLTAGARARAQRFAGRYAALTSCWSCNPQRLNSVLTVTANPDGTLDFAGSKWIPVDSLRFVRHDGSGYIAFQSDRTGAIHHLFAGAFYSWQKLPQ
ncbi:MAG: hypothetical protein ACRERX_16310 [Pseudomonas sp.]